MDAAGVAQGRTPLCEAAYNGKTDTAKMLIEAKADINQPDNDVSVTMEVRVRVGMSVSTPSRGCPSICGDEGDGKARGRSGVRG